MSSTLIETPPHADLTADAGLAGSRGVSGRNLSPWKWMILTCLLLSLSGGWRAWRDHQFARLSTESQDCPFSLAELPKTLGVWEATNDKDQQLDPEIAKVAGSTDHLIRTYVNSNTGEKVIVLVLYGLAKNVFGHTPEICYPASGYQPVTQSVDFNLKDTKVEPDPLFRKQVYRQQLGLGKDVYSEVYYAFRHGGIWKPDMAGDWKTFRYQPGMFKIQTSREVSASAANPSSEPSVVTDSLVRLLVEHLEDRIKTTALNNDQKKG